MKNIKEMSIQEMRQEMLDYPCDKSKGYAFISYSHRDREKVYPLVLSWMRLGYNLYIDLDFALHGSDTNWIDLMARTLSNRLCRLAICFGSVHYTYSYAALLELLTIRGKKVNNFHGDKLPVDYYVMGEISMNNNDIRPEFQDTYRQYFDQLENEMGDAFLSQNAKERDSLLKGLDYWMHQENCPLANDSAEEWMENLSEAYEAGYQNFFPMIANLNKKWIVSQGLNTNCYSMDTELRIQEERFASQGVEKIQRDADSPSIDEEGSPEPSAEINEPNSPLMDELRNEFQKYYGKEAHFRPGQAEAILGVLEGKRTLVVQKTGWGKSLVYFLATKMLRKRSRAVTLIISPLLALMNNQIESATRLGLEVKTINSENEEEWDEVFAAFQENAVDALIISPERLANEDFKKMLVNRLGADIGLFVVDEAHCISDWGHDFRPDYRRIVDIINLLPANVPVLATTATANDRVVRDIKAQLGENLLVSRGSLMRESLAIQVIHLDTKEERLAWLSHNINSIPGTGLIYCLTVNDCRLVQSWLAENGIASESYYAGVDRLEGKSKQEIVDKFMANEIKVLVATVAFGMGFDKPDIGFVIHFQKPGNVVAYYQQIGRAGRQLEKAYAILLCGNEDDAINQYFIDSAFPTENLMNDVVAAVTQHPGLRLSDLERYVNMKKSKIQSCVKYLMVNGDIYKENNLYYKTPRPWHPDLEKSREITAIRNQELQQMNDFTNISGCYMEYIAKVLDDPGARECGKCANCVGHVLITEDMSREDILHTQQFIRNAFNVIEPRQKWPVGIRLDEKNTIPTEFRCEEGRVLSNYGDAGWGRLVSEGKYRRNYFDGQLVEASRQLLQPFVRENEITWVTAIPSLRRPQLVRDFAVRLAQALGLPYLDAILKSADTRCQKELYTSILQYQNAFDSFTVGDPLEGNVLLVDDMVDSKWTFTVCGYKLRKEGCGKVYPFALANSAGRNGGE